MSWLAKRRERKANEAAAQRSARRAAHNEMVRAINRSVAEEQLAWKRLMDAATTGDRAAFMELWSECSFEGWNKIIALAMMCGRNSTNQNKE